MLASENVAKPPRESIIGLMATATDLSGVRLLLLGGSFGRRDEARRLRWTTLPQPAVLG